MALHLGKYLHDHVCYLLFCLWQSNFDSILVHFLRNGQCYHDLVLDESETDTKGVWQHNFVEVVKRSGVVDTVDADTVHNVDAAGTAHSVDAGDVNRGVALEVANIVVAGAVYNLDVVGAAESVDIGAVHSADAVGYVYILDAGAVQRIDAVGAVHCLEVGAEYSIDAAGDAHRVDAVGVVYSADGEWTSQSVYVADIDGMIVVQIYEEDIHDICEDDWYYFDEVIW